MGNLVRFDWAMKTLLRSQANFSVLAGFLSELLCEDITVLEIRENESNQENVVYKFNQFDLLIRNSCGTQMIIEVNNTTESDYLVRLFYATSKAITEHIASGDEYSKVKKAISVNIVYFDIGHGDDYLYHGKTAFYGMHSGNELLLNDHQKLFYQRDSIHQLYPEYYIIKVNQFDDVAKSTFDEWIYFLKHEEIKDSFSAKGLKEARQIFDVMRLPKTEQAEYLGFQEALRSKASLIKGNYDFGKIEGREEGRVEGRAEGRAEALLDLLECRFGPLPTQVTDAVKALSPERLKELTRQVITAHSLADLHLE